MQPAPRVDVRFRVGTPLGDPLRLLPAPLRASVAGVTPLVNSDVASGRMARWFRFELVPGADVARFIADLETLGDVEVVERAAESAPDPGTLP